MTPDQIRQIVEQALRNPNNFPWLAWVITFFITAIAAGFGAYCGAYFDTRLEDHRFKNQIRLAALDTRLAAHQTAYALWRELLSTANSPKVGVGTAFKCQEWWNRNCLYLSSEVREAFRQSFTAAFSLPDWISTVPKDEKTVSRIEDLRGMIEGAGSVILASVSLPPMANENEPDLDRPGQEGKPV